MSIVTITDSDFEQKVTQSSTPVVLDFWAEWCAPCKALTPVLEELSKDIPGVTIAKLNIDQNPQTPQKFGVRGIPTLVLFKGGEAVATKVGVFPKAQLAQWIQSHI